ncbi:hypothetical protein [Phycicoccus flavus]|uniref:hypothetical protein n=1 Tax=Phycicoccus flavus TaxID=2502783 RepID=UPI000FEB8D5D|nr:hypothetical protein [Phycicoccus flavus]NHA66533.1 hypothetical protein [Phycicoccus flavus]
MPAPLPAAAFPRGAFRVRDLAASGVPASRTRHPRLLRPTRGLRATEAFADVVERALGFAAVLPSDVAFSHVTAAVLHGLPLPSDLAGATLLHVMRDSARTRVRRAGCRGHRGLERRGVTTVDGLRVTSPEDTWCDLGELLGPALTWTDLVVAGDAVVGRLPAGVATLSAVIDRRRAPRGAVTLQDAVAAVRPGVRSPMETRARLVVVGAGLPEPAVCAPVLDRAGTWLLEGDLVWHAQRVLAEYQGAVHASRRRRSEDAQRLGLARDEGWTVVELFAEDLLQRSRRVTTLLRLARELGADPRSLRLE